MDIEQAVYKSRAQRVAGWAFLTIGALFYFVALLLFLYNHAKQMAHSQYLWQLGRMLQNFVAGIYQATQPYIGLFWDHAPTLNANDPFSYGNLLFLGLVGLMMTGKQLNQSGKYLRRRIDRHLERLEELQWRDSARAELALQREGQVNFYQVLMPSTGERDWWQEPWGIIGLSIVSGYAVAVLAKITGML